MGAVSILESFTHGFCNSSKLALPSFSVFNSRASQRLLQKSARVLADKLSVHTYSPSWIVAHESVVER